MVASQSVVGPIWSTSSDLPLPISTSCKGHSYNQQGAATATVARTGQRGISWHSASQFTLIIYIGADILERRIDRVFFNSGRKYKPSKCQPVAETTEGGGLGLGPGRPELLVGCWSDCDFLGFATFPESWLFSIAQRCSSHGSN